MRDWLEVSCPADLPTVSDDQLRRLLSGKGKDMVETGRRGWAASLRQAELPFSRPSSANHYDSATQRGPLAVNAARTHTSTSWARVNHDQLFRSVVDKVQDLAEEANQSRRVSAESAATLQCLQARLCALAAAVAELPEVFQSSVGEVVAGQERLHADLLQCRQQMHEQKAEMREHKAEMAAMLAEVRRGTRADVEAERARTNGRVATLESELEAAVGAQQQLRREAVKWEQQRRREATAVQQKLDALAHDLRVVSEHSSHR